MPQEASEPARSQPVLLGEAHTDDKRCLNSQVEVQELLDIRNGLTAKSQAAG